MWNVIKKMFIGENQVRPPTTFTIKWEEVSDPANFFVEYWDDAIGLAQWDWGFDDFFWYEAVVLNNDWNIVWQPMKQSKWVFTSTMSSFISWKTWNVMIRFPIRWIKMSKSWSTVTLSMTKEKNKDWYQYYAFNSQWVAQNYLYLWAYKWSISNSKLVSISWASSIYWFGISTAVAGANEYSNHRYHEMTWYARQYINALYMMKYWNPYSRSVIWNWARGNTGGTNSLKNASWAVSNRVRLFGLEDLWWNGWDILEWSRYANSTLYFNSNGNFSTSSHITSFDKSSGGVWAYGVITKISWSNDALFAPAGFDKYGNANTYYCDKYNYDNNNQNYSVVAGNYNNDTSNVANWLFFLNVLLPESNSSSYAWCRLMYL